MKGGNQRCTLTAYGHIATAEIGHGSYAGDFGDAVGVADLQRKTEAGGTRVINGLSVAADGLNSTLPSAPTSALHNSAVDSASASAWASSC